ncbi:hypothetical protein EDM68_03655 [Candidatus Uhrbacteria bacterium]|nr:MAG: hypothetical protein EDM68_03655 [Candidatus Uhrbacteria bacterium]
MKGPTPGLAAPILPPENLPERVDFEIEVPRGGFVKRGPDGRVDFVSPVPCPFNYGSAIGYWSADGDPTDVIVLGPRLGRGHRGNLPVFARVRMRDRLKAMNEEGAFPKGIELKVGVGLNTGEMVVGNIGAELRFDYTVIGDSVNLASRTESLCKEYGAELLVTQNTVADLGDAFHVRLLDQVAVKGKKEPIRIYEVLGLAGEVPDERLVYARRFETALDHYFARRFDEALRDGEALLAERPEDAAAKHLAERCRIYKETPPPPEWNGTWVMTKK